MPTAALPKQMTPAAIAWHEAKAWMETCPQFYSCPENSAALNNWLAMRELPVTAENLQAAYENLMEAGQLYLSAPDPQPIGGNSPYSRPAKPKIAEYRGSHYDKKEISRLKRQIAVMNASELKQFMSVNGWSDFPPFLKV